MIREMKALAFSIAGFLVIINCAPILCTNPPSQLLLARTVYDTCRCSGENSGIPTQKSRKKTTKLKVYEKSFILYNWQMVPGNIRYMIVEVREGIAHKDYVRSSSAVGCWRLKNIKQ